MSEDTELSNYELGGCLAVEKYEAIEAYFKRCEQAVNDTGICDDVREAETTLFFKNAQTSYFCSGGSSENIKATYNNDSIEVRLAEEEGFFAYIQGKLDLETGMVSGSHLYFWSDDHGSQVVKSYMSGGCEPGVSSDTLDYYVNDMLLNVIQDELGIE